MKTDMFTSSGLRISAVMAGTVALFALGWWGGRMMLPAAENPVAKIPGPAAAPAGFLSDQRGAATLSPSRGTFRDLVYGEKVLAARTSEEWHAAWREHLRHQNDWGLLRQWAVGDPHGAFRTAVEAAGRLPVENQEHYDHQALGNAAINQLFRQDPKAAVAAMRKWAELYGAYPSIDCLHLLVTGTDAQKAALREFVSAGDEVPFHYAACSKWRICSAGKVPVPGRKSHRRWSALPRSSAPSKPPNGFCGERGRSPNPF